MISDELDKDADHLDDERLLEIYLGVDSHKPAQRITVVPEPMDWPPVTEQEVGLTVDNATLVWFKINHLDWQGQIRIVLRAWVDAQTASIGTLSRLAIRA